jgi:hypothetical protein
MADEITAELISQRVLFNDEDFESLVMNEYFLRIPENDDEPNRDFMASSGFMAEFKELTGVYPSPTLQAPSGRRCH